MSRQLREGCIVALERGMDCGSRERERSNRERERSRKKFSPACEKIFLS